MDYQHFLDMGTYEFLTWLNKTFPTYVPQSIKTSQDMERAADELLKLSSMYAYITELASWFKIATREAKRTKVKSEYENMVDKKDAVENKASAIKQAYAGISRAVAIRMENNAELRMTGSKYVA